MVCLSMLVIGFSEIKNKNVRRNCKEISSSDVRLASDGRWGGKGRRGAGGQQNAPKKVYTAVLVLGFGFVCFFAFSPVREPFDVSLHLCPGGFAALKVDRDQHDLVTPGERSERSRPENGPENGSENDQGLRARAQVQNA